MHEQDKILPEFLRELAHNIENNKLNSSQLQSVGEFYVSYLFNEDTEVQVENNEVEDEDEDEEEMSDKDFKKFLALGWYIYNKIIVVDENIEK